ncbi:MAG: LysR family transcriptional regulator [Sutterella sp.]|nr:LysR family transcriptional regulator [Sutterella sp.]
MTLDQLDLHLMKIFLSVYKYKNASLAANELGITNSSVSRGLATLRSIFNDELFLRTVNGFVATNMAEALVDPISGVVNKLTAIDNEYTNFDPYTAQSQFQIRVYDEFSFAVQQVIINDILKFAPNMSFDVRILTYDCTKEIETGNIDFAVVYEGFGASSLEYKCFANTGDIYLLMRKDHPLMSKEAYSLDDISKYSVLEIDNYSDTACPLLVDVCKENEMAMKIGGYTESVASAFQFLSVSDCVTVMCNQFTRRFAQQVNNIGYRVLPPDVLARIREKRSEIRPIGNYLIYGQTNKSRAFEWVKDRLFKGLQRAWIEATNA